jgi:hypothetical protein
MPARRAPGTPAPLLKAVTPTISPTKNGSAYTASVKQPTEQADAKKAENESEGKHGGGSRNKARDGRAFHHHRGANRI